MCLEKLYLSHTWQGCLLCEQDLEAVSSLITLTDHLLRFCTYYLSQICTFCCHLLTVFSKADFYGIRILQFSEAMPGNSSCPLKSHSSYLVNLCACSSIRLGLLGTCNGSCVYQLPLCEVFCDTACLETSVINRNLVAIYVVLDMGIDSFCFKEMVIWGV